MRSTTGRVPGKAAASRVGVPPESLEGATFLFGRDIASREGSYGIHCVQPSEVAQLEIFTKVPGSEAQHLPAAHTRRCSPLPLPLRRAGRSLCPLWIRCWYAPSAGPSTPSGHPGPGLRVYLHVPRAAEISWRQAEITRAESRDLTLAGRELTHREPKSHRVVQLRWG